MQEMQETGQPPSEIVKELAPGLEFDGEGMPVMPNMVRILVLYCAICCILVVILMCCIRFQGAGMFPGMAGLPGFPSTLHAYVQSIAHCTH
jgi:hypothetical protein